MSKAIKLILWILTITFGIMLSGCSADEPVASNEGEMITIQVGMPQDAETRVAFDDINLKLTWQTGDKLLVTGLDEKGNNIKSSEEFSLVSGDGTSFGSFRGKAIPGAKKYAVYYKTDDSRFNYQTQIANNSTEHLRDFFYMGNTEVLSLTKPFELKLMVSIMKLVLTDIPPMGNVRHLLWMSDYGHEKKKQYWSMNFPANAIVLDADKNTLTAYFCFLPSFHDSNHFLISGVKKGGEVEITLHGDKAYKSKVISSNGKTYQAGKRYTLKISNWTSQEE